MIGFYFIGADDWHRLVGCLLGFIAARFAVLYFTKTLDAKQMNVTKKSSMELSPDQTIFWEYGFITINLTLVTTWGIMLLLVVSAGLLTRKLKTDIHISRWQCFWK